MGIGITQAGSVDKDAKEEFSLTYAAYGEIYIRPLPNLEWYFEADVGNISESTKGVTFAASTGITWYLPQF